MAEPRTVKEGIYDEQISPLMSQIIEICKTNNINFAACFSLGYDEEIDETLFCSTALPCDESDEFGYERINELRDVMVQRPQFAAFTIHTSK